MPVPRSILHTEFQDLDLELASGVWPTGLSGEFVAVAPGPRNGEPYALFTPGHIVRLSMQPGTFGAATDRWAWRTRRIESPTARLIDARPDVWSSGATGFTSPFGLANMANTAVMPWSGRLFATWDVGRPVEIDPITLDFLGDMGSKESWGPSLPIPGILPFTFSTAHPVVDPERDCLWTVKLGPGDGGLAVSVVRYDGEGAEVKVWPVADSNFMGTMHTITQTRDWLILIDSGNFKADPAEMMGQPRSVRVDEESPAFLVRKEDLEKTPPGTPVQMHKFIIAPPTGHFYARYDDSDGIRVIFEHMDGVDLGYYLREDDVDIYGAPIDPTQVGFYNMGMAPSSLSEIEFDIERNRIEQTERIRGDDTFNNQLSAMDWSLPGLEKPQRHHMLWSGFRPHNISRRALDAYKGRFDEATYPDAELPSVLITAERGSCERLATYTWPSTEDFPSSPIFVPRGAGAHPSGDELAGTDPGGQDGWVIVPVLNDGGLRVECFDAAAIGDGPVATLRAPGGKVSGGLLHSCWLAEARPAPDVERLRFSDDLSESDLAALPDDLAEVARTVAREIDEQLAAR